MKLVFLDIDGVMNSRESYQKFKTPDIFCEEAVASLNDILGQTDAKIVISSSWRCMYPHPALEKVLVWNGIDAKGKVLGDTPEWRLSTNGNILGGFPSRGDEIYNWLENFIGKVSGICILDDTPDMRSAFIDMSPWLVLTDSNVGLKRSNVARAIRLLNRPFDLLKIAA